MIRLHIIIITVIAVVVIGIVLSQEPELESAFISPIRKKPRTYYLEFAGKTYYFGTVFLANFYRAMQFCRQQGMQLVSIGSQVENDRLGRFAEEIGAQYGHFWTSGNNYADKSQWIWLSTGHNFVYTNWHPGEPSGPVDLSSEPKNSTRMPENCVEARHFGRGFTWNDLDCRKECYFICEGGENC